MELFDSYEEWMTYIFYDLCIISGCCIVAFRLRLRFLYVGAYTHYVYFTGDNRLILRVHSVTL